MKKEDVGVGKAFTNFYKLFNLPLNYNLTSETLEEKYLALQKIYHPDNFSNLEQKEKAFISSLRVNEGYDVLKSPIERAKHLLLIAGEESQAENSFEFLEEILELREEAKATKNKHVLLEKVNSDALQIINKLSLLFEDKNYTEIKILICKLQYLTKISQELDEYDPAF